jgi:hypothetical protein
MHIKLSWRSTHCMLLHVMLSVVHSFVVFVLSAALLSENPPVYVGLCMLHG